jgi:hypothetical protein
MLRVNAQAGDSRIHGIGLIETPDMETAVYRHRSLLECRLNTPALTREEFGNFLKRISSENLTTSLYVALRRSGEPQHQLQAVFDLFQ